jgi:hypothetical protein
MRKPGGKAYSGINGVSPRGVATMRDVTFSGIIARNVLLIVNGSDRAPSGRRCVSGTGGFEWTSGNRDREYRRFGTHSD